jgi:alpha-amylase/alpha-mannosidase (GH57 family)
MIKHETITVSGTVLYCDACRRRGPESAYDNIDDTLEQAEMMGWTLSADDRDLCDECTEKEKDAKPSKSVKETKPRRASRTKEKAT